DRLSLSRGDNFAESNRISDYARWVRTYRPAIAVDGVGNRVSHNLIHDAPHLAILLHGNDHLVEFNEVHDVCLETEDAGAFYMGRDYTERGNVIRFNYFHDIGRTVATPQGPRHTDTNAIYLDDGASGALVFGNICCRTGRGVKIG